MTVCPKAYKANFFAITNYHNICFKIIDSFFRFTTFLSRETSQRLSAYDLLKVTDLIYGRARTRLISSPICLQITIDPSCQTKHDCLFYASLCLILCDMCLLPVD